MRSSLPLAFAALLVLRGARSSASVGDGLVDWRLVSAQAIDGERHELQVEPAAAGGAHARIPFLHGTTTLAFRYDGGVIVAVDSRASLGSFIGSRTTTKALPVSPTVLGTMAGGAADCSHWVRRVSALARLARLERGEEMGVREAARCLSRAMRECMDRGLELSVGSMVVGRDARGAPAIYYVDNQGSEVQGDVFAVGSGSTYALSVLDEGLRADLPKEAAVALARSAISCAAARDGYSGGYLNVYHLPAEGGHWERCLRLDTGTARRAAQGASSSSSAR